MDTMPVPTPSAGPVDPNAKNILSLVTYLPFLFIYIMIKKGDQPFFVHHSKNAAGYLVLALALSIILQVLIRILSIGILSTLFPLVNLALFLAVFYFGAYGAWQGKLSTIPVVSGIGAKIPLEKWFKKGPAAAPTPATAAPTQAAAPVAPAVVEAPAVTETPAPAAPTEPVAPASAPTQPENPTPPVAPQS